MLLFALSNFFSPCALFCIFPLRALPLLPPICTSFPLVFPFSYSPCYLICSIIRKSLVIALHSSLWCRRATYSMATVITNYFDQITPARNGQFHNTLILSSLDANSVIFNNMVYQCVWSHSIDGDGQWKQITVSFSRKQIVPWPVETYVRVGPGIFMLQSRHPSISCDCPSEDGTFYDVPLKILRVLSSSTSTSSRPTPPGIRNYLHHGPGASCVEYYWQATYQAPIGASGDRPLDPVTCVPARSLKNDDATLLDYAVVSSEVK